MRISPAAATAPSLRHIAVRPGPEAEQLPRLQVFDGVRRLVELLGRMDVPYYGKYSVERLEGLRHYSKAVSWPRALLVCVATPFPALAAALLIERIPLQSPLDGWRANWGFWLRVSLSLFVVSSTALVELAAMAPTLALSLPRRIAIAAGNAAGYTGFFLALAVAVGFPVPMMWQLGAVPASIVFPLLLLAAMDSRAVSTPSTMRTHVGYHLRYFVAHLAVFGLYPMYMALYDSVPARYQVLALLALPAWRAISKRAMIQVCKYAEDFLPLNIALVVDVFDSLFLSVCLQNATSVASIAVVLVVDCAHSTWIFHDVRASSRRVGTFLDAARLLQARSPAAAPVHLLDTLAAVAGDPAAFRIDRLPFVRLWAYIPLRTPPATSEHLARLQSLSIYRGGRASTSPLAAVPIAVGPRGSFRTRSVTPAPDLSSHGTWTPQRKSRTSSGICPVQLVGGAIVPAARGTTAKLMLEQGVALLFHCEYVLLVEYVEAVVPVVYIAFEAALSSLPNADYYPRRPDRDATASAYIIAYSLLEIASLVALGAVLGRRFRFSTLHQLAYVLETHVAQVQAKFFVAIVCLLQFRLTHFGTPTSWLVLALRLSSLH